METRANYVAAGAFVLVLLAGLFVTVLWLARVQFETEYKYYETDVPGPVSGLATGALVRLNGIEIGRVTRIGLDPKDPQRVALILEVRNSVEIRADAVASLESQGLTGVSYIEISGGTLGAPLLVAAVGQQFSKIASRRSSLQEVLNTTPELLARLIVIADRITSVLDDKNQEAVAEILANMRDATVVFGRRTKDIDQLITDSGRTMHNLASSSDLLQGTLANLRQTSDKTDRLADSANAAVNQAGKLASDLDGVVESSRPGLRDLTTDDTAQLSELLGEARRLIASLNRVSVALERDPSRFLFGDRWDGYRPK